jgi:hypothetical protein
MQWQKRRPGLTDVNRVKLAHKFLDGDADYLFQMDDDTVPPYGAIGKLLGKARDFIGGLYFLPGSPHNPIAYYRQENGLYYPVWNYPEGALLEIDAIGMGCTLIHRSLFEKILAEHEVFQRPEGSLLVVHKSQVCNRKALKHPQKAYIKDGFYHMPVVPKEGDDDRGFPFFALEYGRTEDYYFCELALNVGSRPWLDTTIVCNHYKPKPTGRAEYKEALASGIIPEPGATPRTVEEEQA